MLCCLKGYAAILCTPINFVVYVLGWITLIVAILNVSLGPEGFQNIREKVFAFVMDAIMKRSKLRIELKKVKTKALMGLKNVKSVDPTFQKQGALRILEIGVGTGTNLEYYPAGSRLVCVDPNAAFEAYFRRECAETAAHLNLDVSFVVECGEDMVSVADESVDVVVMTLVMCSVREVSRLVREVRRVLVPGGKFFFMEHVGDSDGTWRRRLQNLFSDSGIWPALFVGCRLTGAPKSSIMSAGFSEVEHDVEYINIKEERLQREYSPPNTVLGLANPFLYGVATK